MRALGPLDLLTAKQLALFLGVTPSAVRQMARRDKIKPAGKHGRENLYAARAFVDTVGGHDRIAGRKRRKPGKVTDAGGDHYAQEPV